MPSTSYIGIEIGKVKRKVTFPFAPRLQSARVMELEYYVQTNPVTVIISLVIKVRTYFVISALILMFVQIGPVASVVVVVFVVVIRSSTTPAAPHPLNI